MTIKTIFTYDILMREDGILLQHQHMSERTSCFNLAKHYNHCAEMYCFHGCTEAMKALIERPLGNSAPRALFKITQGVCLKTKLPHHIVVQITVSKQTDVTDVPMQMESDTDIQMYTYADRGDAYTQNIHVMQKNTCTLTQTNTRTVNMHTQNRPCYIGLIH